MTISRRGFLVSIFGVIGMPVNAQALSVVLQQKEKTSPRLRAYRASKILSTGKKAPLADVQTLIVDLMPSIVCQALRCAKDLDTEHRISYMATTKVRLVVRGGKRKLESIPSNGEIDLKGLLDAGILTPEGADKIRDGCHDIC